VRQLAIAALVALVIAPVTAQQPDNSNAPVIPFVSVPDYLKYSPEGSYFIGDYER